MLEIIFDGIKGFLRPGRVESGVDLFYFFFNLRTITLRKRQKLILFIEQLRYYNITFHWGFPFKHIVEYRGKHIVVKNSQEAKKLWSKLEGGAGGDWTN